MSPRPPPPGFAPMGLGVVTIVGLITVSGHFCDGGRLRWRTGTSSQTNNRWLRMLSRVDEEVPQVKCCLATRTQNSDWGSVQSSSQCPRQTTDNARSQLTEIKATIQNPQTKWNPPWPIRTRDCLIQVVSPWATGVAYKPRIISDWVMTNRPNPPHEKQWLERNSSRNRSSIT